MEYLKNGIIRENTSAPGLKEARKKLQYLTMSKQERAAYDEHINAIMIQNDVLDTAKMEGKAEGRAEGRAERDTEIVQAMYKQGFSVETIAGITGLSIADIQSLLKR